MAAKPFPTCTRITFSRLKTACVAMSVSYRLVQSTLSENFISALVALAFEQLSAATHYNELAPEVGLHLCLDGYHMGVGGDDSWTPSTKKAYLLLAAQYTWAFSLA